jgi:hypothetical protein
MKNKHLNKFYNTCIAFDCRMQGSDSATIDIFYNI